MPYRWSSTNTDAARLQLWPYRSLSPVGFVWFIGLTAGLIALPLVTLIGKSVMWGLLPFVLASLWAMWWALSRNARDRMIMEELSLSRDRVTLVRHNPRGPTQSWEANPHWVRVNMHATGGPVPHYVTLSGNGREVEIGAFLSEEERVKLGRDLRLRLADLR